MLISKYDNFMLHGLKKSIGLPVDICFRAEYWANWLLSLDDDATARLEIDLSLRLREWGLVDTNKMAELWYVVDFLSMKQSLVYRYGDLEKLNLTQKEVMLLSGKFDFDNPDKQNMQINQIIAFDIAVQNIGKTVNNIIAVSRANSKMFDIAHRICPPALIMQEPEDDFEDHYNHYNHYNDDDE